MSYLKWMSEKTPTQWCNDSAMDSDIFAALGNNSAGCTSNPPLTYEALTTNPELYADEVKRIDKSFSGDDRVTELIGVVVRHIADILKEKYEKSGYRHGYIRAQVMPELVKDAEGMLKMGLKFATWRENVMVKIPGSKAGLIVLEELAARGIPTNPTVCTTLSQMISAAQAYERGYKRAVDNGISPAPSTSAFVMGRLQDYLSLINTQRNLGLGVSDLELSALAVAKRCHKCLIENGFKQKLMPAAFRCAMQVVQLSGADAVMTIHPKIQKEVATLDSNEGIIRKEQIDMPVDEDAVNRVIKAIPEFMLAYEPGALREDEFESFGANIMTLENFDKNGWQMLKKL